MSKDEKKLKFLAMAFLIFIFLIFFSSLTGLIKTWFSELKFPWTKEPEMVYSETIEYEDNFNHIDIDLKKSDLIIKTGTSFKIEIFDRNIKAYNEDDTLKVTYEITSEESKKVKDFIMTIPANYNFDDVKIKIDTGSINIDDINANTFELSLGNGHLSLNNIVSNNSNIENGAGNVEIKKSKLNNLNLGVGIGKIDMNGEITGESLIISGIGKANISLDLPVSEYTFKIEESTGKIKLNNETISNAEEIGNGKNHIIIESGVGGINIKTSEQKD